LEQKRQIMVVDDDPGMFDVIEALLYREGYELTYVSSGKAALDSLDTVQPDVILLDVMMPGMDGLETCRLLRADSQWKHIPVIMVTALDSKDDLVRALDAGADDFLSKPVNGAELRARVRSMLRIKEQYDTLANTLTLRQDLSNMVVHDLRNPLSSILLSSQLLLMHQQFDDKALTRIETIQNSAKELNSMINDLLILAKMEAGKLLLNLTEVDIRLLVTEVVNGFREIAEARSMTLQTFLPDHPCWHPIDTHLFHRLLDNLLSNAIKFSPSQTSISVRILDAHLSPDSTNQSVTVQVADEGPGISEELRQRIFEKYETGDRFSATRQLGLGLTFCKMVAEAHGGRIYVENNHPTGSVFSVEI
jgi:signal transduction histidine kinase